jgi:hypothetical protein
MSRRWMVCSLCGGARKWGPLGDRCTDCAGLGGSYFGDDQAPGEIETHLASCREALRIDEAEYDRVHHLVADAWADLAKVPAEKDDDRPSRRLDLLRKQLEMVEDSVNYWRAMIDVDLVQLSRLGGKS